MRICILNITSGNMCWGYRNYLTHLLPRLAVHPDVEALLVGVPQTIDVSQWRKRAPSVEWLTVGSALLTRGREVGQKARKAVEQFSPDVIFIPTARYWSFGDVPAVSMVRNMMPATRAYSAHLLDYAKNWARFIQMRSAVKRSSRVIAVSQFVGNYLSSNLAVPTEKIGVVHHGIESSHGGTPQRPASIPDDWCGRFVFVAGSIYPYRGLEDIIFAWDHMDAAVRPPVVIAGFIGHGVRKYYNHLRSLLHTRNLESQIRFVGPLTKEEMVWCYRDCTAFLMTSRVEACPNIALEAMASGCLCVSTDSPPMPEIFGDAALYYPAGDASVLVERVLPVLQWADDRRDKAKRVAVSRAREFTWEACCDQTVRELQKVLPQ